MAAREDEFADEIRAVAHALVELVLNRDGLDHRLAVGLEQFIDLAEIGGQKIMTDRLDHFDRDQLVVLPFQRAVIRHQHGDLILQAGLGHTLRGQPVLLLRNRGGGDLHPVVMGGMDRETAPATADFDHMLAGAQVQLATDGVILGLLRLGQTGRIAGENAGRIGHAVVQEQLEEFVAQVVVGRDVPAAAFDCVAALPFHQPIQRRTQRCQPAVHGAEGVALAQEQAGDLDQLAGVPQAQNPGLADAGGTPEGGIGVKRQITHLHFMTGRVRPAQPGSGTVRVADQQLACLQLGYRLE